MLARQFMAAHKEDHEDKYGNEINRLQVITKNVLKPLLRLIFFFGRSAKTITLITYLGHHYCRSYERKRISEFIPQQQIQLEDVQLQF